MHELSVAQSVVEIVNQNLPAGQPVRVSSIRMRLGELSGVVADSLEFCFTAITAGTPLEGASLVLERVPLTALCRQCSTTSTIDQSAFVCPDCGGNSLEIVSGRELQVIDIEIND